MSLCLLCWNSLSASRGEFRPQVVCCAEEEISGGEDDGHEASPDGVLADENRAEGSTPANRPMGEHRPRTSTLGYSE